MSLTDLATKLGLARPGTRRLLLAALGVWAATAVLAFLVPVSAPVKLGSTSIVEGVGSEISAPQEDLETFLNSQRWGKQSLLDLQRQRATDTRSLGLNPELGAMGFVGLLVVPTAKYVLLTLEDGTVQRYNIGDQLPDGRVLNTVDDNRLVLTDAGNKQYELLLFPKVEQSEAV